MDETSAGKLDSKAAVIPRRSPNRDSLAGCTPRNAPSAMCWVRCAWYLPVNSGMAVTLEWLNRRLLCPFYGLFPRPNQRSSISRY